MYNELLNQLEKRIQEAVETIEMYRLEIAELKEKNMGYNRPFCFIYYFIQAYQ